MHATTRTASAELPPAGSCTCSQVRGLARRLTGLYDAALAPLGLTVTQYAALMTLARADGALAIGELASRLQMDRSTTSRLLAPLQREGLVAQPAPPAGSGARTDHRARLLRLTPRGERRLRAAVPAWTQAQQQVDALLGEPLVRSLARVTRAAAQALAAQRPCEPRARAARAGQNQETRP